MTQKVLKKTLYFLEILSSEDFSKTLVRHRIIPMNFYKVNNFRENYSKKEHSKMLVTFFYITPVFITKRSNFTKNVQDCPRLFSFLLHTLTLRKDVLGIKKTFKIAQLKESDEPTELAAS